MNEVKIPTTEARKYLEKADVLQMLQEKISKAFKESYGTMQQLKKDMRTSAYALAVQKVVDALEN